MSRWKRKDSIGIDLKTYMGGVCVCSLNLSGTE